MEFKKRLESLEKIIAMGEKLLTTFDIEELLDALVDNVSTLMSAQGATLYLVDPFDNRLVSQSIKSKAVKEISVAMDHSSIAGYTATTRRSLNIRDAYSDLSDIHPDIKFNRSYDEVSGVKTRNIITHPLVVHGELIGVFQVVNKLAGDFNDDDQVMLRNFSLIAAIAIMNARLMEQVMEAQSSSFNVIENTSDMVIVQNRNGLILQVNRSASDFLRQRGRNTDVSGRHFAEVFPELINFSAEIKRVIDGRLDKAVSNGIPAYVILTERNLSQNIEKVTLIVKNIGTDNVDAPVPPTNKTHD
ncbi:MAG: GAF protein [uncultured bacterium]|nr:MAG: GAF protein [uncultured bacterium]